MIAIVGTPGSVHHTWERFERTDRTAAEVWTADAARRIMDRNPTLGTIPTEIVSDKEATRRRYQDGTPIYTLNGEG